MRFLGKIFFRLLPLTLLLACNKAPAPLPSAATPSLIFSGTLDRTPELQKEAEGFQVLFILARGPQNQIIAVKKMNGPFQFPLAFSLSQEDVMIAGTALPQEFNVTARLDKDGDANPAQAGDIVGKAKLAIKPGDKDVRIILSEKVN